MSLRHKVFILFICAIFLPSPILGQNAPSMRIRGTIDKIEGKHLSIAERDGRQIAVELSPNAVILAPKPLKLSDIAPGSFIGTAAMPIKDGFVALEVLVFPEAMRGTGEGHYDWDLLPGSTMTNANVDAVVTGNAGRNLTLSYKGGNVTVSVPEGVPVVTPVPAVPSDIKTGVHVMINATRDVDGHLAATRVWVEKDGVAPPM